MFKKYMLKLSNTVGTVNYLHKITKENDKNNNNQMRKHKKHHFSHHNNHHRNTMTAEMLLDIGAVPVVPEVTTDEALMDFSRLETSDEDDEDHRRVQPDESQDHHHDQPAQQKPYQKLPPAILSAAILNLRNTLMFYPLVLSLKFHSHCSFYTKYLSGLFKFSPDLDMV